MVGEPGSVAWGVAVVEVALLLPAALMAITAIVYGVPFVRPLTVVEKVLLATLTTLLPGLTDTRYPVIAVPPFGMGADHDTEMDPLSPIAVKPVGGLGGGGAGVAFIVANPEPTVFLAYTLNQ